jgi:hypothetical protein
MWSNRDVLDSLFWEAACGDMGIYPRATITAGVETPRTDWQDGWNAAVMALSEKHTAFTTWAKTLTPEQREMLTSLLDSDGEPVVLQIRAGAVVLLMMCSDTFMYACADGEDFTLAELPDIAALWKTHGYYGLIAWIARKRHAEPVKEYRYTAGYLAAKADLPVSVVAVDPVDGIVEG